MSDRPNLYFRRKDNGAAVFRITEGNNRRMDLQQIAMLKHNSEVKLLNNQEITETEMAEISAWHEAREAGQNTRDTARIDTLIGDINAAAQWLQSSASDAQVSAESEPLLMAIHDLRTTLVKRMGGKK